LQRGRTHWILWLKRFDDNWGKWEKPIAIARCPWKGLQLEARVKGAPVYEVLKPELGFGLTILPEPSPGDIFLDFEGDPYVGEGGFEYLLGYVIVDGDGVHQYTGLLANVLDWHRRENKSVWWEYYRLSALPSEELLDERSAISGLLFLQSVGGTAKAPIHRYNFPIQETDLRGGEDLKSCGGAALGKLEEMSFDDRTVDIKKRGDTAGVHPEAIFAHQLIQTDVLANALFRIGEWVADRGISGDGEYQTARDLLLRLPPVLASGPMRQPEESALGAAVRIAPKLSGVLPIQGPPGSGKTFIGARMICELVDIRSSSAASCWATPSCFTKMAPTPRRWQWEHSPAKS
jgi:hypothetical protein